MQKEEETYQPTEDKVFLQRVVSHDCLPEWMISQHSDC
jgi:hypothetical protein